MTFWNAHSIPVNDEKFFNQKMEMLRMKDKAKLEIKIGLVYILVILIARGIYIYVKEKSEPLLAIYQVAREFGALLLVGGIGVVILFLFIFVRTKLFGLMKKQ